MFKPQFPKFELPKLPGSGSVVLKVGVIGAGDAYALLSESFYNVEGGEPSFAVKRRNWLFIAPL